MSYKKLFLSLIYSFYFISVYGIMQKDMSVVLKNEENDNGYSQIKKPLLINIFDVDLSIEPHFKTETLKGYAILSICAKDFRNIKEVVLDAKAMVIHSVFINTPKDNEKTLLEFDYNDTELKIKLNKTYGSRDTFFLHIAYTTQPKKTKPDHVKPIDNKGVYFINASGKDKYTPQQIWTQGEPENNSQWFPISEDSRHRITQTLRIKVLKKFQTLSNGSLVSQNEEDSFRTDVWKMTLPHSPYLVFFGVGNWHETKDSLGGIGLSYYVDSAYGSYSKKIFGNTPKMIAYFEKLFGVPFVWNKYGQVVVQHFVSGAMENTTMVVHETAALQDDMDLYDENIWENSIVHEVCHHWFGNLVAAKNWSHLSLQESFANYCESIWAEHTMGKEYGAFNRLKDMTTYFYSNNFDKKLFRENLNSSEEVFDEVTYNKGGAVLHMLRKYVGDSVFFKSLKVYLKTYEFKTAEIDDLRRVFEEVSGEDLKWFFNQWYYVAGNPALFVEYITDTLNQCTKIVIKQSLSLGQKPFRFPLSVYQMEGGQAYQFEFMVGDGISHIDTLKVPYHQVPDLLSIDPERNILFIKQEQKTTQQYLFQLKHSPFFAEKNEALFALAKEQKQDTLVLKAILKSMQDSSYLIRISAIEKIDATHDDSNKTLILKSIQDRLKIETNSLVIAKLLGLGNKFKDKNIYNYSQNHWHNTPSAKIGAICIQNIYNHDSINSLDIYIKALKMYRNKNILAKALKCFLLCNKKNKDINVHDFFEKLNTGGKLECLQAYMKFLLKTENKINIQEGLINIIRLKNQMPEAYQDIKNYIDMMLNDGLQDNKKITDWQNFIKQINL